MPRIPKYTQQVTPSGRPTAATISPSVAETGAGAIGAGMASIGAALSVIGEKRQAMRDRSALADVEHQYDVWNDIQEKTAAETEFESQEQFDEFRKTYTQQEEAKRKELLGGLNSRIRETASANLKSKQFAKGSKVESTLLAQERGFWASRNAAALSDKWERYYAMDDAEKAAAKKDIDNYIDTNNQWHDEGELAKESLRQRIEVLSRLGQTEEATKLIEGSELHTATEKTALDGRVKIANTVNDEMADKDLTEQLANREITLDSVLAKKNLLSQTNFKSWVKTVQNLTNEPLETNYDVKRQIRQQIMQLKVGAGNKEDIVRRLRLERYNKQNLKNADFDEMDGLLEATFRSTQAAAFTKIERDSHDFLVPVTDSQIDSLMKMFAETKDAGGDADAAKFRWESASDQKKWQEENHSQYMTAVQKWLSENPDVDSAELEKQSKMIRTTFKNRSMEDIKASLGQIEMNEIEVINPQGVRGVIPSEDLAEARAKGWLVIQ